MDSSDLAATRPRYSSYPKHFASQEVGNRLSTAVRAGARSMIIAPEFDVEAYHHDNILRNQHTHSAEFGRKDEKVDTKPAYHIYSTKQKWGLVWIIGAAGVFSGLSSNIYFPAIDAIARDLRVDVMLMSFTITSYLVVQGLSPIFWGYFADGLGRRPIYIYSFTVYIIANIVLSLSPNFAVLLVFRGIQAAGSASTVSIGNGVIQDITVPSERGEFLGFYQAIRNSSIAVGPVLGGLLANFLGFRAIFVSLLILSSLTLVMIIVVLPETIRSIAGNGTLCLHGIHKPLIWTLGREPAYLVDADTKPQLPERSVKTFVATLGLLTERSVFASLIPGGIVYAIWSMVTASTTSLFKQRFHLNELLLGLVFLPNGLGTIIGSTIVGQVMSRDYKLTEREYKQYHGFPEDYNLPTKDLPLDFPIERARLRSIAPIMALFIISVSVYGWTLAVPSFVARPGAIAVPLVLQFFIAATSNAVFAVNQTLVSDLCPGRGASSAAMNNLVRCSMGAVGVAFVDQMIAATSVGLAFSGLGLLAFVCVPFLIMEWEWGLQWRMERETKAEAV